MCFVSFENIDKFLSFMTMHIKSVLLKSLLMNLKRVVIKTQPIYK